MKNLIVILLLVTVVGQVSFAQTNFIKDTGNVGIGMLTPGTKLEIYRNVSGATSALLKVEDDNTSGYAQMAFFGTQRIFNVGVGNHLTASPYTNQFFIVDGVLGRPRLMIDASGTVSIGTTLSSGGGKLTIYPTASDNSGLQFLRLNSSSTAGTDNGKVLSLDGSGNVVLLNDGVGTSGWAATGNTGTTAGTNYIGTIDSKDLVFKTNSTERMRVSAGGGLKVGTGTDKLKTLQVFGTGYVSGAMSIGTDSVSAGYKLFVADGIRTRKVRVDIAAWSDYVFNDDYKLPSLAEVQKYISENNHLPGIASATEVQKEGIDLGENQSALLKKIEELTLYIIDHNNRLKQLSAQVEQQQQKILELNKQLTQGKSNQ